MRTVRWMYWVGLAMLVALPAHALPDSFVQEGLVLDGQGLPIDGEHTLRIRLYDAPAAGQVLFDEIHRNVSFFEGYYAVQVGGEERLTTAAFQGARVFLGLTIDGGDELTPRTPIVKVPAAFTADVAENAVGDITPRSVRMGGQLVVDDRGRWVGDPTGLQGPVGPEGPAGPDGAQGPRGPAGGNGSPDTPQQVRAKLVQVDGAGSGVDADALDGLDAGRFMRTDRNTGTSGTLAAAQFHINIGEQGGGRPWMTHGTRIGGAGNDGGYFGLKVEGNNRADTVIAFGDDADESLRVIYTGSGGPANGVERMRVTSGGAVGIGTAAPRTRLDVAGAIRVGMEANCDNNRGGALRWNGQALELCDGRGWQGLVTGVGDVLDIVRDGDGAGSGLDADRLDGLDSAQFMRADRDTGTTGRVGAAGFDLRLGAMGGTRRDWMTDGLRIGAGGDDGAYFGMKFEGDNAADTVVAWGDDPGDDLRFIYAASGGPANGAERMRILSSGQVGIGTTNPRANLEVAGGLRIGAFGACDANLAGTLRYQGGRVEVCNGAAWQRFLSDTADVIAAVRAGDGAGSGVDADRLDGIDSAVFMRADRDTGTVGVLSASRLHVGEGEMGGTRRDWMTRGLRTGASGSDGAYFGMKDEGVNNADTVVAWGDDAGDDLRFIFARSGGAANGEEFMRILSTGNIGIGTSSPQARLDVAGAVKVGAQATCNANAAGAIRWSGARFEGCNGSRWVRLDNDAETLRFEGLLAHWELDSNWRDSSGNNQHGSGGGQVAFDASGLISSARFNGAGGDAATRSYGTFPSINPLGAMTVSAWIRSGNNNRYNGVWQMVSKYSAWILGTGCWDCNNMCFIVHTNGRWRYDSCHAVANPQEWHHFVGTYDSANGWKYLYVDGVRRGSVQTAGLIDNDGGPIDIGHRECCDHGNFNGWIDDIQLYDRALSANEVQQLYNSYAGRVR